MSRLVPDQGLLQFFTAIAGSDACGGRSQKKAISVNGPPIPAMTQSPQLQQVREAAGGHLNQTLSAGGSCAGAARLSSLPRLEAPMRGNAGTQKFLRPCWSIFGNCVDRKFVGFPPIPQKKAEWMGHGSLQ